MTDDTQYYKIIPEKSDIKQGWHYVSCPLCQHDHASLLLQAGDNLNKLPGGFNLLRCQDCGFSYTNPRPFGEELGQFYPDEAHYYQPDVDEAAVIGRKLYPILEQYLGYGGNEIKSRFLPKATRAYRKGVPHFVPGGRLLEVGCSYGKYLAQMMRQGWEVEGIELNQQAAAYAINELGLPVRQESIENMDLQENHYDCIVMRMSLEHVASPLDVLVKLHSALRKGGEIIITVPNYACPEARYFGEYAYFLHVPMHMSHFTPHTLGCAMKKVGYQVRAQYFLGNKNDIVESAKIRARVEGEDWLSWCVTRKWFLRWIVKPWMRIERSLKISPRMVFYAEKPK